MAYVAISNELQDAVQNGIRAMARKEYDTIGSVPKLTGQERFVEQALWGAFVHLRGQIPNEWKQNADRILLRIEFPDGAWQETAFLGAVQDAPPRYNMYSPPKAVLQHDHPEIAHIATVVSNLRDARKRWDAVEAQVLGFLRKCKSLNEGLKLWPDLRMYIPAHFIERVERKVERPKSDGNPALDVLKSINTDDLVAAAVIARMSTGGTDES